MEPYKTPHLWVSQPKNPRPISLFASQRCSNRLSMC
jgi:hypothetical protein